MGKFQPLKCVASSDSATRLITMEGCDGDAHYGLLTLLLLNRLSSLSWMIRSSDFPVDAWSKSARSLFHVDLVRARGDRDDGEGGGVCECDAQRGRATGGAIHKGYLLGREGVPLKHMK